MEKALNLEELDFLQVNCETLDNKSLSPVELKL